MQLLNQLYIEGVTIYPIVYDVLPITQKNISTKEFKKYIKIILRHLVIWQCNINVKNNIKCVKNLSNSVGNIGFRDASAYHLLLGGSGESHLFRKQKEKINEEIKGEALKIVI